MRKLLRAFLNLFRRKWPPISCHSSSIANVADFDGERLILTSPQYRKP
jgi:hypothetical protein